MRNVLQTLPNVYTANPTRGTYPSLPFSRIQVCSRFVRKSKSPTPVDKLPSSSMRNYLLCLCSRLVVGFDPKGLSAFLSSFSPNSFTHCMMSTDWIEADRYFRIGLSCLSMQSIFYSPEVASVQTLFLFAYYNELRVASSTATLSPSVRSLYICLNFHPTRISGRSYLWRAKLAKGLACTEILAIGSPTKLRSSADGGCTGSWYP